MRKKGDKHALRQNAQVLQLKMHVFCRIFFFQLTVAIFSNAAASELRESFAVVIKRAQAHLAGAETAGLFGACQPAIEVLGHALPETLCVAARTLEMGRQPPQLSSGHWNPSTHLPTAERRKGPSKCTSALHLLHVANTLVALRKLSSLLTRVNVLFTFATVSNCTVKLASVKPKTLRNAGGIGAFYHGAQTRNGRMELLAEVPICVDLQSGVLLESINRKRSSGNVPGRLSGKGFAHNVWNVHTGGDILPSARMARATTTCG